MKKLIIFALATLSLGAMKVVNAADDSAKRILVTTYERNNGRSILFGLAVRYNYVGETLNNLGDNNYHIHVSCSEPGNLKCKRTGGVENYNSPNGVVSGDVILQYEEEIVDAVEEEILQNKKYSGSISRTIEVNTNGSSCILLYTATWTSGNENGDAAITVEIYDITNSIR